MITAICSNKPRPAAHTGRRGGQFKTGECLWGRDVFHSLGNAEGTKTACGLSCDDWLKIGAMKTYDAVKDDNFCKRCAKRLTH